MPGYIPMGVPTSAKVGVEDNAVLGASCGQGSQASMSGDPKQALVVITPGHDFGIRVPQVTNSSER